MRFFFLFFALAFSFFPQPAFADVSCRCFCATEQGAMMPAGGEGVSSAACETLCLKADQTVVVCATDPAQYPANFFRCFTRDDCTRQCKEQSDPKDPDTCFFGIEQPKSCLPGHHYCYRNDKPYTLAYGIPEQGGASPTGQKVADVGEFINLMYKFLLWGGVTIAIVMIMIGGFKMVLSATTDKVKGGKEQIRNAVIGLVLLIMSGLILQTVNPQLLSLTPPKLPMLKTVDFLGAGQGCEELFKAGNIEIDASVPAGKQEKISNLGSKQCGSVAAIRAKAGKTAIPAGSTCTYTKCPGVKMCLPNGDKSLCLSCGELNASLNEGIPSASSCEKLKKPDLPDEKTDVAGVTKPVERNYCFYTHDPGLIIDDWKNVAGVIGVGAVTYLTGGLTLPLLLGAGATVASYIPDLMKGTCAELILDCRKITSCVQYDEVKAENENEEQELNDLYISSTFGSVNLETICQEDPCKVGTFAQPCKYNASKSSCLSDEEKKDQEKIDESSRGATFGRKAGL